MNNTENLENGVWTLEQQRIKLKSLGDASFRSKDDVRSVANGDRRRTEIGVC